MTFESKENEKQKNNARKYVGILFVILILFVGGYYLGFEEGKLGRTLYVTNTFTSTTVKSTTSTVSSIYTSHITTTVSATVTLPQPQAVTVSGNASTKSLGTVPLELEFVSSAQGHYKAPITQGRYSITLPNHVMYIVTINYNLTPTGGGSCFAGNLPVDSVASAMVVNWLC